VPAVSSAELSRAGGMVLNMRQPVWTGAAIGVCVAGSAIAVFVGGLWHRPGDVQPGDVQHR
jgi:hypothetical protein